MHQTPSHSSITKTRPKTSPLQPQASTFPPTIQKKMYKYGTFASTIPEKMAAKTPAEIGTRGTVGSLIMQEIEYFSRLELGSRDSFQKPRGQLTDMASTSIYSRPIRGSLIAIPKKKKKRGGSRLVPSMCSLVEVADSNIVSGFNYRNLKADVKRSLQA